MSGFSFPDSSPIAEQDGACTFSWKQWFSQVSVTVNAARQSGSTADRPTRVLWVGRRYFDTDLGLPVYFLTAGIWVDSTGAVV